MYCSRRLGGAAPMVKRLKPASASALHRTGRAARRRSPAAASSTSRVWPACRSCRSCSPPAAAACCGQLGPVPSGAAVRPRRLSVWGEPIEIAADLDAAGIERARLLVETRMNEMAREADRRVGHAAAVQNTGQSRSAPSMSRLSAARRPPSRPAPTARRLRRTEPASRERQRS